MWKAFFEFLFLVFKSHLSSMHWFGVVLFAGLGEVVILKTEQVMSFLHDRNNRRKEEDRDKVTYGSAVGFACYLSDEDLLELVDAQPGSVQKGSLDAGAQWLMPEGQSVCTCSK